MHPHRFGTGTVTNDPSVVVQTSPRHPPQELAREPRLPTRPSSAHPRRAPPAEAFASPGRRGSTRRGLRAPHGRTPHLPRARWRRRGWCVSSRHRACARKGSGKSRNPGGVAPCGKARRRPARSTRSSSRRLARCSPGSAAQCRHAPRAHGGALSRAPHARGRAARSFARAPCNPILPTRGRCGFPALDSTGTLYARVGVVRVRQASAARRPPCVLCVPCVSQPMDTQRAPCFLAPRRPFEGVCPVCPPGEVFAYEAAGK